VVTRADHDQDLRLVAAAMLVEELKIALADLLANLAAAGGSERAALESEAAELRGAIARLVSGNPVRAVPSRRRRLRSYASTKRHPGAMARSGARWENERHHQDSSSPANRQRRALRAVAACVDRGGPHQHGGGTLSANDSSKRAASTLRCQGHFPLAIGGGRAAKGSGKFAIVSASAVDDQRLGHAGLRVLCCLGTYADKDGLAFPGMSTICERLGLTRTTVVWHLQRLEALGYVEIIRRTRADGGKDGNHYRLRRAEQPAPPMSSHSTSPCRATRTPMSSDARHPRSKNNPIEHSDPNGSDAGAPGADRDGEPLQLIRGDEGDWGKLLFGAGLDWLARVYRKPPEKLRRAMGKLLQLAGDDHKAVFDGLAEAEASGIADPVGWLMGRFRGKHGNGPAGAGERESRRPGAAQRERRLDRAIAS